MGGEEKLISFSKLGLVNDVRDLADKGIDVNYTDSAGNTAIFLASFNGHEEIFKLLIDYGAEIDLLNKKGESILYLSIAGNKSKNIIDALFLRNAPLEKLNFEGLSSLFYAIDYNDYPLCNSLIGNGANVNAPVSDKYNLLWHSLDKGYFKISKLLLDSGANFQMYENEILCYPEESNEIKSAKLLIDSGANLNCKCKQDITPLLFAIANKNFEYIRILIEAGANYSSVEDKLIALVGEKRDMQIGNLLIKRGFNINSLNQIGNSILSGFVADNNLESTDFLISLGADVNIKTHSNMTALHIASYMGHYDIALSLIKAGADVNARAIDGKTPLIAGTLKGNHRIYNLLLSNDANKRLKDNGGRSAKYYAKGLGW